MRKSLLAALLAASLPAVAADPAWVGEARNVASSVPPKLVAVLTEELGKTGPEGAIAVCSVKAPEMAKAATLTRPTEMPEKRAATALLPMA